MSRRTNSKRLWWLMTLTTAAACGGSPPDEVEQRTGALTFSSTGTLMPFGGQDGTCIAVNGNNRLEVASCTGSGRTFIINGPLIQTPSDPPLCVEVRDGDPTAWVVDVAPCHGAIWQRWFVSGGQIVSAIRSDAQDYCLDVYYAGHEPGTPVGVVPCNGTGAQAFWPAGYTMKIASTYSVGSPWAPQPECLDVYYDNETAGAPLNDSVCNGGNAQWFIFDQNQHIALANSPGLCLATGAPYLPGVPSVSLANCSANDSHQNWTFINSGTVDNRRVAAIKNAADACLDIAYANPASPTDVVNFTCNGGSAQRWRPSPSSGELYVAACGGSTHLACPETNQFCERATGACATTATADPAGLCATVPVTCSGSFDPVCGCNGRTYSNDCERQAAGASKWFHGPCSTSFSCPAAAPTQGTACSQGNISCVYSIPGGPCVQRLQCTNGVWSAPAVVCSS